MIQFPLHTLETAPAAAKGVLADTACGKVPNMLRTIAESPAALTGFQHLRNAFSGSSLTPIEQQVVFLSVAKANACHYCTTQAGPFDDGEEARAAADAIRADRSIADPRLQALRRFTVTMTTQRGWVREAVVEDFLAAGYSPAQVLDVICGIALGTLSSYTNHVAATPLP